MYSPKKGRTPGSGRKKGSPNKATATARVVLAELMQLAAPEMAYWLARVAKNDPKSAFDLALRLAEFHVPKLGRTEHVGDGGGPVVVGRIELIPLLPPDAALKAMVADPDDRAD